jgi:hypothetical protein
MDPTFVVLNYFGRSQLTPTGAADVIERFLRGEATAREWDDFTSVRAVSAQVEEARKQCVELEEMHSAQDSPSYLDPIGVATLGDIARALRMPPNKPVEPTPKEGAADRSC